MSKPYNLKKIQLNVSIISMLKQFHFKQFSLALVCSLNACTQFNCQKTFLFKVNQFDPNSSNSNNSV